MALRPFHGSPSPALPTLDCPVCPPAAIAPLGSADGRGNDVGEEVDALDAVPRVAGAPAPAGVPPPEPAVPDGPVYIPTTPLVRRLPTPVGAARRSISSVEYVLSRDGEVTFEKDLINNHS